MTMLPHSFRLIMMFRDDIDIILVVLERHDNHSDPYAVLEEMFDLPIPEGEHRSGGKPECCSDSANPPTSVDLIHVVDILIGTRR